MKMDPIKVHHVWYGKQIPYQYLDEIINTILLHPPFKEYQHSENKDQKFEFNMWTDNIPQMKKALHEYVIKNPKKYDVATLMKAISCLKLRSNAELLSENEAFDQKFQSDITAINKDRIKTMEKSDFIELKNIVSKWKEIKETDHGFSSFQVQKLDALTRVCNKDCKDAFEKRAEELKAHPSNPNLDKNDLLGFLDKTNVIKLQPNITEINKSKITNMTKYDFIKLKNVISTWQKVKDTDHGFNPVQVQKLDTLTKICTEDCKDAFKMRNEVATFQHLYPPIFNIDLRHYFDESNFSKIDLDKDNAVIEYKNQIKAMNEHNFNYLKNIISTWQKVKDTNHGFNPVQVQKLDTLTKMCTEDCKDVFNKRIEDTEAQFSNPNLLDYLNQNPNILDDSRTNNLITLNGRQFRESLNGLLEMYRTYHHHNEAAASDIARLLILAKEGGFYVDCDGQFKSQIIDIKKDGLISVAPQRIGSNGFLFYSKNLTDETQSLTSALLNILKIHYKDKTELSNITNFNIKAILESSDFDERYYLRQDNTVNRTGPCAILRFISFPDTGFNGMEVTLPASGNDFSDWRKVENNVTESRDCNFFNIKTHHDLPERPQSANGRLSDNFVKNESKARTNSAKNRLTEEDLRLSKPLQV